MLGISFHFGFNLSTKERAKLIKNSGFECVITSADKSLNKYNGSIRKQIKWLNKCNIKPSSLHMTYKNNELKYFWLDSKIGTKIEKSLIRDIRIANRYAFNCVVVHLVGEYSDIGIERLKRILKIAKKYNVYLAIENINYQNLFIKTMESIDDEYLKFCYDSGHNHVFDPEFDYLERYGEKLIALHLHDNDGTADQHTLNRYGSINWNEIANKLAKCPKTNIDYELLLCKKCDLSATEVLSECYNQAKELEKLIEMKRSSQ